MKKKLQNHLSSSRLSFDPTKLSSNTIEHEEPSSIYLSRPNPKMNESKEVQSINFATPRSKDRAQFRDKKKLDDPKTSNLYQLKGTGNPGKIDL